MKKSIAIIGGGAAGFFSAIQIAEKYPDYSIEIFEKSNKVLAKVKVSGGGRCNVTHHCFQPEKLISFYPRGGEFLLQPFQKFGPKEMVQWLEKNKVKTKIEKDGRMFPESNSSQTIIDCFLRLTEEKKIKIHLQHDLTSLKKNKKWELNFVNGKTVEADAVLIAGGSSNSLWKIISSLGHTIIEPVPSLFTFNIDDTRIKDLPGLSVANATAKIKLGNYFSQGPVLITHWGLSGPLILKLSAWEAVMLAEKNYKAEVEINFTGEEKTKIRNELSRLRDDDAKKLLGSQAYFDIPTRLWKSLMDDLQLSDRKWAGLGNKDLDKIAIQICEAIFLMEGKSTFKDEFVTCGGVSLEEIDNATMESKICPSLFFAGEIMNIDAVTGGFNFQAAWTTGFVAGQNI